MDAYKFFRQQIQCFFLTFKHIWYEDICGKIAIKLLNGIQSALNEDCIDEIANRLDIVGFADLFSACRTKRLHKIAVRRFSNVVISRATVGRSFGVLNLHYILQVIGDVIQNITISLHSFRDGIYNKWNGKLKYSILSYVCNFTGPNLQSIRLQHFVIDTHISYFRLLIDVLQARNVVIHIE